MKAGIYDDLPESEYLATDRWVSSSQLKRFLPEFYKPFNGSTSADFGSVFHQRFTGEDVPVTVVAAATWQGKAAQEVAQQCRAAGTYAILEKDVETIDRMVEAVHNHGAASDLLVKSDGVWEQSFFTEVEGVPSKCRFDRVVGGSWAVDIKTTKSGPGQYSLSRAVLDYGYDLANVHYAAVAESAGVPLDGFSFVFVQNCEPFHVTVATLDEQFLERGRKLRDLALERYLHPGFTDPYPGASEVLELSMPRWAKL